MTDERSTLDCQDCGKVILILSAAQAQKVAANPYNYVLQCRTCQAADPNAIR